MRCAKVRRLLFDYLDGALDEKTSETLQTHLKRCDGCTRALEEYRTYREKMAMLKDTHAPDGFLAGVKGRIRTFDEKDTAKGPTRIFTPGFKLPLELAGALAVVLIAVVIFRHIEPGKKRHALPVAPETRTEQVLPPAADKAETAEELKEDRAPTAVTLEEKAAKRDIQKEARREPLETETKEAVPSGGAPAGAPPVEEEAEREAFLKAERPPIEADMEMREPVSETVGRGDGLRDSVPTEIVPAVELTLSGPQPSKTVGVKKAEKEELRAKETVTAKAPETAEELQMRDRLPHAVKNEIRELAEKLGGMVISIDHGTGRYPHLEISVRIPRSGYDDFLDGLSLLGVLESPVPEVPPGEGPALLVRITITQ
jgi:anti-sigma factor RsiW